MTKKKKVEEKPLEETEATVALLMAAPPENKVKKPSDLVKCRVVTGTIIFEQGTLERGSVFTVTRQRAALFEKNDVEILA